METRIYRSRAMMFTVGYQSQQLGPSLPPNLERRFKKWGQRDPRNLTKPQGAAFWVLRNEPGKTPGFLRLLPSCPPGTNEPLPNGPKLKKRKLERSLDNRGDTGSRQQTRNFESPVGKSEWSLIYPTASGMRCRALRAPHRTIMLPAKSLLLGFRAVWKGGQTFPACV